MSENNNSYGRNTKKPVLVFRMDKKLIAVFSSLYTAAKFLQINKAGIYNACNGKAVTYQSMYFRYLYNDIEVTAEDLNHLTVIEYDHLCQTQRKVYTTKSKSSTITKTL